MICFKLLDRSDLSLIDNFDTNFHRKYFLIIYQIHRRLNAFKNDKWC